MVALDFRSKEPIYRQIMAQIQEQFASGELKPGQQLPTVRKLATQLGVNFNTVARAYRLLDQQGVISTQHGRGTRWAAGRWPARAGPSWNDLLNDSPGRRPGWVFVLSRWLRRLAMFWKSGTSAVDRWGRHVSRGTSGVGAKRSTFWRVC
jgi:hypothetical protein